MENGSSEIRISAQMIHRVIKHFKKQDKTVIVIGASYGAFLTTKYLADFGNTAHKFVILVGRLDMPAEVWLGFANKKYHYFPDAVTPEQDPAMMAISVYDAVHFVLIGAATQDRYTEKLEYTDMSNVIFVSGKSDQSVGRLTEKEKTFLLNKGVDLIEIESGDHSSPFRSPNVELIWEKILH